MLHEFFKIASGQNRPNKSPVEFKKEEYVFILVGQNHFWSYELLQQIFNFIMEILSTATAVVVTIGSNTDMFFSLIDSKPTLRKLTKNGQKWSKMSSRVSENICKAIVENLESYSLLLHEFFISK